MTEPTQNPSSDDGSKTNRVSSIEDRLTTHLHDEAEMIPVAESLGRPASLDAVRARAERRRSRRQAGLGAVAAACIAVVGFGAIQLGNNDQENDVAAVETTTTVPGADEAASSDAAPSNTAPDDAGIDQIAELLNNNGPKLAWEPVDGLPEGAQSYDIAGTSDAFYVTGLANGLTTVYRSTDGRSWLPVAEGLEIGAYRIQASDGILLLEGSAEFASETEFIGPFEPQYLLSRDDGLTWSTIDLPAPEPLESELGLGLEQSSSISIAAAGDTVVAVRSSFVFADIAGMLAEDGVETFGWGVTDEGVEVYTESDGFEGISEEPILIPFEEISALADSGLTNEELADQLNGDGESRTEIFRSVGDGPFEPIDLELGTNIEFASVSSIDGAILLQVVGSSSMAYRSQDGLTWSEVDNDVEIYNFSTGGQSLLGYGQDGMLESTDGGQTWEPVESPSVLEPMQLVRTDLGVTVVASPGMGPSAIDIPTIEVTKENLTFMISFEDGSEGDLILFDNQTGEELRRIKDEEMDGDDGPGLIFDDETETIEIYSLETDELLFTFTVDEMMNANPEMDSAGVANTEFDFQYLIGHHNGDGEFGWTAVSDFTDSPEAFPALAATDSTIILSIEGPAGASLYVADRVAE